MDLENESCLREGNLGVDSFEKSREANERWVWPVERTWSLYPARGEGIWGGVSGPGRDLGKDWIAFMGGG